MRWTTCKSLHIVSALHHQLRSAVNSAIASHHILSLLSVIYIDSRIRLYHRLMASANAYCFAVVCWWMAEDRRSAFRVSSNTLLERPHCCATANLFRPDYIIYLLCVWFAFRLIVNKFPIVAVRHELRGRFIVAIIQGNGSFNMSERVCLCGEE